MIAATGYLSIGVFAVALWLCGVVRVGAGVLQTARSAVAALRDEALDDAAREKAVQGASIRLFGAFLSILARGALALAISLVPVALAVAAGLADSRAVVAFLSRWDTVVIGSAAVCLGYVAKARLWPSR